MKKFLSLTAITVILLYSLCGCNQQSQIPVNKDGKNGADGVGIIKTDLIRGNLWIAYSSDPEKFVNIGKVVNSIVPYDISNTNAIPSTSSRGLSFRLNEASDGYVLSGVGICTDTEIVIDMFNGLPVKSIGDRAFEDCKYIKNVRASYITKIGEHAFSGCTSLESIDLPDSLTEIGTEAFSNCLSLKEIKLPSSINFMKDQIFLGVYPEEKNGVYYIDNWVVGCAPSLDKITLKEGTIGILPGAFDKNIHIKTVYVPASLKIISERSFTDCSSLERIDFGGTKAEWKSIGIQGLWDWGSGDYYVQCSDGTLTIFDFYSNKVD